MRNPLTPLGGTEMEVLRHVWDLGTATVRDVHDRIRDERRIAYTTVMTVMKNLAEKGYLSFERDGAFVDISYSSCTQEHLPLWEIEAELTDGTRVLLEERFRPALDEDFGPASLTYAEIVLAGESRAVDDYWGLVYAAAKHNEHAVYWVVPNPPVTAPGVEQQVYVVMIDE